MANSKPIPSTTESAPNRIDLDLICPTCHGSGRLSNRWRVHTRVPGKAGTQVTVNGTGSLSFEEADRLVQQRRDAGDLAWMEPVNEGYPTAPTPARSHAAGTPGEEK